MMAGELVNYFSAAHGARAAKWGETAKRRAFHLGVACLELPHPLVVQWPSAGDWSAPQYGHFKAALA